MREIGLAFDIKSPMGVMCHLKALEKNGLIKREGFSARALMLLDDRPPAAIQARESLVPLLGVLLHLVTTLDQEAAALKDDAKVREDFLADMMAQKRCPDCQRTRDQWYW